MATRPATQTTTVMTFDAAMSAIGMEPYSEQSVMARALTRIEDRGSIGFVEAPTATGKTLVMAHRAVETAMATARCVVVAVPTIEIAHQTLGAVNRIAQANEVYRGARPRIVLGKQEFVSIGALRDLATTLPAATAKVIADWLDAGGIGPQEGYPDYTIRGLEHVLDLEGLGFDIPSSVTLGPGEGATEAGLAYSAQFEEGADVVIATHAMLARDLVTRYIATNRERRARGMTLDAEPDPRKRWLLANDQRLEVETGDEGRLPDHRRLIVDEAHLLRQNIEGALTTGIAVNPLIRHVATLEAAGGGAVPAGTVAKLKKLKSRIALHPLQSPGESLVLNWSDHKGLGDIVEALADIIGRIKTSKIRSGFEIDAAAIDRARYALQESIRAKGAVRTTVEWSPVAAFPTITVGRQFLGGELRLLWDRLESASLVSATLYTENISGPSMKHSAAKLFVPDERQMEFAPIQADWLLKPVTVFLPEKDDVAGLTPDDGDGREAWISAMAEQIAGGEAICDGTLVLSTSRATSHDLSLAVAARVGADRVLDGSTMRVSAGRAKYVAAARSGMRPIWFAQGPAWTGLDLPDDTIDTLFVTRLPYPRPDADDTSGARTSSYGAAQMSTMMMTLKQGIGRLVRIRGARPKRVVVLDGRVLTSKSAKGALTLLNKYRVERF